MSESKPQIINRLLSLSRKEGSSEEILEKLGNKLLDMSDKELRIFDAMSTEGTKGPALPKKPKTTELQKGGRVYAPRKIMHY